MDNPDNLRVSRPIVTTQRRPGRRSAKEANPNRYKADLKFYRDWQASGLSQREFVRERGLNHEEGVKSIGRGKHHEKKSGDNSEA